MIFSANPGPDVLGLTAHLIPQVNLGLSALFNTTSASVYLYFDASLGLQGSVSSGKKPQSCLSGNAGINVEMGAQGSFFDIFGNSTGQSIFEKNFTLFQVRAYSPLSTFFFRIFIIPFTRRQHCYDGNSSSLNSSLPNPSFPNSSLPNSSSSGAAPQFGLPTYFKLLFRYLGYLFPYHLR